MKKLFLPLIALLSGCAVQPQHYDLSTSGTYEPIQSRQNLPNLEIVDFKYEPHVRISQNSMSQLGCLPCQSDGSTPGVVFSNTIAEIVQSEVSNALKEVMLPSQQTQCQLSATIHMAGWDAINGDSIVDLTYTLLKEGDIKSIKRIRGYHDNGMFETNRLDRFLAKASRKSVSMLLTDSGFLQELNKQCPVI